MKNKIIKILFTIGLLILIFKPITSYARTDELIFEANTYNIGRTGSTTNIIYNKYGYSYLPYDGTVIRRLERNNTNSVNIRINVQDLNTGTVIHNQTINNSTTDGWYYQPGTAQFGRDVNIKFYYVTYDIKEPDDPPTNNIDYTNILNQILNRLNLNSDIIKNININITNITNKIDITNERLTTINNTINTARTQINNRLDTINTSINSIKNELTTNRGIERNQRQDWSNNLRDNKPNQPQNRYTDNNQYFSESGNTSVNSSLPQASEPKMWDDVEKPIEMNTDKELSKDEQLNKDNELTKEEFIKDEEITKEEFIKDSELSKDDELNRDTELSKDNEFSRDTELSKDDEFSKDTELEKDYYYLDDELEKENFDKTHEYEQNHNYEQNHYYEQDDENYNLRWKSTNGFFH